MYVAGRLLPARALAAVMMLAALAGCGGGSEPAASPEADGRANPLSASAKKEPAQALTVVLIDRVSETRVGRTSFDYTFKVVLRNDGQPRANVLATIVGAGAGTTVRDASAFTAGIDAGQQLPMADTVTVRHDRAFPFDMAALRWSISSVSGVTIRGVIADRQGIAASVEIISLIDGGVVARGEADENGVFAIVPIPTSAVSAGYMERADILLTPSGSRQQAGSPSVIPFEGIYADIGASSQSHATLLTTAISRAAQSTTSTWSELPTAAAIVAVAGVASGLLPAQFADIGVATQYAQSVSSDIVRWGLPNYIELMSTSLTYSPPNASGGTVCEERKIGSGVSSSTIKLCSAEVLATGGRVYDQTGSGSGNVIVDVPSANPGCRYATVARITERGHHVNVWHQLAVSSSTCPIAPNPRQSFTVHLPPAVDAYAGLEPCADTFHPVVNECVTRAAGSNIRPGFFVTRETKTHRVPGPKHEADRIDQSVVIARRYGANLRRAAVTADNQAPVAVMLIHGYTRSETALFGAARDSEEFGGDTDTWGELPRLINQLQIPDQNVISGYRVYNFHWRTDTSFRDAARDLADAIVLAWKQTGERPIHVVAHSFGGILARTTLQGLYAEHQPGVFNGKVASLTTVGTPHSGISSSGTLLNGVSLPRGWAPPAPGSLCGQLSCYEAGLETTGIATWARAAYAAAGISAGELIADLSAQPDNQLGLPADLRVMVLMGHFIGWESVNPTTRRAVYLNGDGLITFYGQRFFPTGQTAPSALPAFQFEGMLGSTVRLTERVLGFNASSSVPVRRVAPGEAVDAADLSADSSSLLGFDSILQPPRGIGYAHIAEFTLGAPFRKIEVAIPALTCPDAETCVHESWTNIRDLLLAMHGGLPSSNFPSTTGQAISVSGANCTPPLVGAPMTCAVSGLNLPGTITISATNCSPSPMTALQGGSGSQRQFSCTPISAGVPVQVSYSVPGFIGPLPSVPTVIAAAPPVTSSFVATGGMRDARVGHTATRLNDGRVLIAGGDSSGNTAPYLRSAEIYSPTTGTFSSTGDMLSRRGGHTATLLTNGKVLFTGGFTEYVTDRTLSSAELYDPQTGRFEAVASMSAKRSWHNATRLDDGRVLIVGGFDNRVPVFGTYLSSAEIFNPASGSFSPVSAMSIPRIWFSSTKLQDGTVLIAGGSDGYDRWTGAAEIYNPHSQTFTAVGSMSVPRWITQSALMDNGHVLFPGGNIRSDVSTTSSEVYSLLTQSFAITSAMNTARQGATVTALRSGNVLVAGGVAGGVNNAIFLNTAELYASSTGQFSPVVGRMTSPRYNHTATLLADGRVLLVGGSGSAGQTLLTAELYAGTGLNQSNFLDEFNGTVIDPAKWTRVLHPTLPGTSATVAGGELRLSVGAWLHTHGNATFTGSKIVIEGVIGDTESSILLLDSFNPITGQSAGTIMGSDTIYRGWGFDVQTGGRYPIVGPTTAGFITVAEGQNVLVSWVHNPAMLYRRLTIDGDIVTFERGSSAATITERLSTRMASSISGRPMTLVLGTGIGPFTPGRFQWIRATVTP